MALESHPLIYETIGTGYRNCRVPDRRIAAQIDAALGDAKTVCNVGAGSGSYEPADRAVTAVEPSQTMIAQRRSAAPVVCATAENLPFADHEFDAAMALLTVHHWTDPRQGLSEMRRIARRQVVLTFDPDMLDSLWLSRDYLPEGIEFDRRRAVPIKLIADLLNASSVDPVLIPWDCSDGFQAAYWRRPEEYLKPEVRAAISSLSQLPADIVSSAMEKLRSDIESGLWNRRYADLLDRNEMNFGYRLIVAG